MLAAFLPQIIDMLTPDGTVPPADWTGLPAADLGDLGGLLGGLLAGGSGAAPAARRPDRAAWAACSGATSTLNLGRVVERPAIVACPCPLGTTRSVGRRARARHPAGMDTTLATSTHPRVPRAGARRLAVHGPARRRPAPRPDLVLVGRRGDARVLEAGCPEGPQPSRQPDGDARARRRRGRLRRRAGRGPRRAARPPDRATSSPPRTSPSTPTSWRRSDSPPAEYAATYSQVIRIVPEDWLPWHGRTTPQSARLAGAPARLDR